MQVDSSMKSSEINREIYIIWVGAMIETKVAYLEQISLICKGTEIFRASHPAAIPIFDMR